LTYKRTFSILRLVKSKFLSLKRIRITGCQETVRVFIGGVSCQSGDHRFFSGKKADDFLSRLGSDQYGGKGKLTGCHLVILAKNGRKIPIRLDATTIYSEEKELATIGFFRDLSEDMRLQPEA